MRSPLVGHHSEMARSFVEPLEPEGLIRLNFAPRVTFNQVGCCAGRPCEERSRLRCDGGMVREPPTLSPRRL